jgi:hypothetical protein
MTNTATPKQVNYLLKLGATAEEIKDLTIKTASIMISKLLKKQKENNTKEKAEPTAKPVEYEHGYKVGDILEMSWGYEQTNLDFFKIVAVTEKTVRLVEVSMKVKGQTGVSGMSRYVSFDTTNAQVLEKSYNIKDQVKGDIKKIGCYEYNGNKNYYIKVDNHHLSKYHGQELYESWYA